ncbi:MAG: hypothetical protein AAF394_06495 [Planctomycetota bacterium]
MAHTSCSIGVLVLSMSCFAYSIFGSEAAPKDTAKIEGPKESLASAARSLAIVVAGLSVIVLWTYLAEYFMAWYSQNKYEYDTFVFRMTGPYAVHVYWAPFVSGAVLPQLFWFRKLRRSMVVLCTVTCILLGVVLVNSMMKSWQM